MISDVASMAALAAVALFVVTGFRAISPGRRLALDGVCFLAASAILMVRHSSLIPSVFGDHLEPGDLWLKGVTVSWWLFGARLLSAAFDFLLHLRNGAVQPRLGSDLLAASIYAATLAIVLSSVFGLPVTGVLATSGVLAIVLGLALQSTLADVFAGIAVGVDRPFRLGDRVRIGDLAEGVVTGANWRSIRIHTDTDDVATIPNSIVAKDMIYNFSFPSSRRAVALEMSVPAAFEPERVIGAILEGALVCSDILTDPKPSARVARLGAERNVYSLSFFAPDSASIVRCKDALLRDARRQLQFAGLLALSPDGGFLQPEVLRLQLLRSIHVLEPLSAEQLAGVAQHVRLVALEPGQHLFEQGATDVSLYAVGSGALEITRSSEGVAESLGRLGAGAYLGEAALISGSAHAVTATALTSVGAIAIRRDDLAPLLAENEALAAAFEQSAQRSLKRLDRKVAASAAATDDFSGRLIDYFRAVTHLRHKQIVEREAS